MLGWGAGDEGGFAAWAAPPAAGPIGAVAAIFVFALLALAAPAVELVFAVVVFACDDVLRETACALTGFDAAPDGEGAFFDPGSDRLASALAAADGVALVTLPCDTDETAEPALGRSAFGALASAFEREEGVRAESGPPVAVPTDGWLIGFGVGTDA